MGTSALPDICALSPRAAITTMLHFLSELTQQLKLRVWSICGDCIYSVACEFRL